MNNKRIFLIGLPIAILLITLVVGSFLSTRADSTEFVITGTTLTKYNGQGGDVVVPSGVVAIGNNAFDGVNNLTSVSLPDSLQSIGYRAFADCKNLMGISIPSSVSSIEDSAFNGDINLRAVSIGAGLNKLGSGVFAGCTSLADISFQANPYFVCESGAVYDASRSHLYQYLAGYPANIYAMPPSVTGVSRYAFWGCDKLDEIICSTGLQRIDDYAFSNCTSLDNVVMYVPLRGIGIGAFLDDSSLKQVIMPDSVGTIQDNAFLGCPSDMIVVCNEGTYGYNYAKDNGYLTSLAPQLVVYERIFQNPAISGNSASGNGVSGNLAESEEPVITTFSTANGAHTYDTSLQAPEGTEIGYSRIVSDKVFVSIGDLGVITGSNDVSSVGNSMEPREGFIPDYGYYNSSMSLFEFSNETKGIGMLSFARSGLTSINIPDGVTEIGYGAFYHCDNLTEVYIPESVKIIGAHAFDHTPWYDAWLNDSSSSDFLIVGDGVLIGYKGYESSPQLPDNVKTVTEGVIINN